MKKGILGRKIGMTGVFTKDGKLIPVTVVEVDKNVVTQIKTVASDGYDAIQIAFADKKEKHTDIFAEGEMVDVTGTSKGKGFQGVIKRHNQTRGPMGHGSQYHRGVGSMGTMLPMRVLPGKKLPGHMGHATRTIQNLEVISVDLENNVILIKGNVPGPKNGIVFIKPAVKNEGVVKEASELVTYITEVIEENDTKEEQIEEKEASEEENTSEESSQEA